MFEKLFEGKTEVIIPDEFYRAVALGCASKYCSTSMMETDPFMVVKRFENYIKTGEIENVTA